MTDPADAPILVFGSGQRTGSTLVQRLLTSHPGVLIWGEHGGHLRELLGMTDILQRWDEGVAVPGREAFEQGGHQGWIANMLPGPDPVRAAARAWLHAYFGTPAAEQGRPRWGFKEVRFGHDEASAIRELFPATTVVHITRDPRDVLVSLDWWEQKQGWWRREFTEIAVRDWAQVNESFLPARENAADWILSVRYEDVVAAPDAFAADAARLIGSEPGRFDRSVFETRVHDYHDEERELRRWRKLPRDLRVLLEDDRVRSVAAAYGYRL